MMKQYKGNASTKAMEPLLRLASLPNGTRLEKTAEAKYLAEVGPGGTVSLELLDPTVRMILRNDDDPNYDVTMHAFGDEHSEAYWFPFSPLLWGDTGEGDMLHDLSEVIDRAQQLLEKVSFFENDATALDAAGRAAAVADYLRMRSGVTEPWLISMSSPFELRLEDESIGDGDGVLLEFGELPPGLDELGECAVVELENEPELKWWMRPAMLSFATPLESDPTLIGEAARRLQKIGFTSDQMTCLARLAGEVAEAYACNLEYDDC